MATSREKFDAAVNVIHSLPKNGPFQPSYEMMLTFYGLYKQATEGKCTKPKPWSWDIVAKKKWDAWIKLEDMAPEQAMDQYVEELKKSISSSTDKWNKMSQNDKRIVEAMPQEKPVRDFMDVIGSFYEIIEEKSPFAGNEDYERRVVQRGNDFSQRDIVTEGVRDFTESLDGVRDYQESLEETSALSILDTEKDQWENRLKNSSNKVNGEIHVTGSSQDLPNGETVYDNLDNDVPEENGTSPDRVESESDDEFCDSFDQPSPDKVLNRIPPMHENSEQTKPIHRKKNQVHFAENSSLKSDVAIHSNVISESVEAERLFSSHNAHSDHDPHNHDETDSRSGQINPRVGYQSLLASGRTINSNSADVSDPRYLQAGPDAQILVMLQRIQQDISTVLTRLDRLEAVKKKKNPRWWPFPFQFPGKHMLFFVIWPVFLIWFFNGRRRKKSIR